MADDIFFAAYTEPRHIQVITILKNLPLPSLSTITRYLRRSNTGVGFDREFFKLFETQLKTHETPFANHGILVFDEMAVGTALYVNVRDMKFDGLVDVEPRYDPGKILPESEP